MPHVNDQVVGLNYPLRDFSDKQYDGQLTDLMPGIEMGQAYHSHANITLADDCCPCECNCDIFTEPFRVRTGAADPNNIEFDRSNARIWTKSGTVALGLRTYPGEIWEPATRECAIFTGASNLKCETPPLRSDDFCTGIIFQFENSAVGQKVLLKFGSFVATLEITFADLSGAWPIYRLQGTLTGSPHTVEWEFNSPTASIIFNAALFIKDGLASLVVGAKNNIVLTGYTGGWPLVSPTKTTSGITSFSAANPGPDFVQVETQGLTGELRLFAFNVQNHFSTVKHRCQKRFYGTEDAMTDLYPAEKYQLDFHYGPGGPLDFTVQTTVGLSKNTIVTYPYIFGGATAPSAQMLYTATAHGAFNGTVLEPGVGNPDDVNIDLTFIGSPDYITWSNFGLISFHGLGVGAMVNLRRFQGGFAGGYVTDKFYHHGTGPYFEDRIARWYGAARSMNAVRLYPSGGAVQFGYDPTSITWVDITAI